MTAYSASGFVSRLSGWIGASAFFAGTAYFARISYFLAGLVMLCTAHAGNFYVNPVRLELSKSSPTETLQVTNSGTTDVTVQLKIVQWLQTDGEDQLTPSRDLVATPQLFLLRAGGSQIIRVGIAKKSDFSKEGTYRLILEEIPPPPEPGFRGLQIALRLGIPIFLKPETSHAQEFSVSRVSNRHQASNDVALLMHNPGLVHAQVTSIKIFSADDKEELLGNYEGNLYVLAGQKKTISIKTKNNLPVPDALLIKVDSRAGTLTFHAKPGAP